MASSPAAPVGASAPDLSSSLISFQTIKNNSKQTLLDILDTAPNPQALIVDPALTNPIGLICAVREMREHKVQEILLLGSADPSRAYQSLHTVFILRPNLELILQIKDTIFHHRKRLRQQQTIHASRDPSILSQRITFSIYFVPRRSLICESILANYQLTTDPDVTIGQFPLDLIPCDFDLLSLELPYTFSRVFIDGDTTALFTIALSVIRLQTFFGVIPLIKGIGKASHRIAELIHRLSCELLVTSRLHDIDFGGNQSGQIGSSSSSMALFGQNFCQKNSIHTHTMSPDSASFNLFQALQSESPHLDQLNHSILGSLSFSNPSSQQDTNLGTAAANQNSQLQISTQLQQTKASLSTQLSSLLNITITSSQSDNQSQQQQQSGSGNIGQQQGGGNQQGGNIGGGNNQQNQGNQQGNSGNNQGQSSLTIPFPDIYPHPADLSRSRINSQYAQNPVINSYATPQITQVMFIDRTADLISPMLLQRTYEGLLDELFGINTQTIEYVPDEAQQTDQAGASGKFPPTTKTTTTTGGTTTTTTTTGQKKKMSLHNADLLFSELRDVNIKVLGQMFTDKWAHIKRTYAQTDDMISSKPGVSDMEKMVKKFKNAHMEHQLLPIHWGFAQKIRDFFANRYITQLKNIEEALLIDNDIAMVEKWIDESIMKSFPLDKILRVIILYSSMYGTINKKKTELWRKDIIQTYGMEMSPLLANLQHLGIFYSTSPVSDEQSIHQSMVQAGISSLSPRLPGTATAGNNKDVLTAKREQLTKLIESSQILSNNDMNLHISISRNGSSPNSPIIRKPIWEKLSARLKLIQTEEQLITIQNNIFSRRNQGGLRGNNTNPINTNGNNDDDLNTNQQQASVQTLMKEPIDINFGFGNFYSPLSIRFVEMAAQPGGLKRLQDHLQVQNLLFSTPYSLPQESSLTSSIFSSSSNNQNQNQNSLHTLSQISSQLAPSSTSPNTTSISIPGGSGVSPPVTGIISESIVNSTNAVITPPSLFEYRQSLPSSLQQRMRIPDMNYFQYPLLSTAVVPLTMAQIQQQSQYDSKQSQFMTETQPKKGTNQAQNNQDKQQQTQSNQGEQQQGVDLTTLTGEEKRLSAKPVCLVYFVGGATYAEVAMLRYLTEHPTHRYAYVVATTRMINAKTLINELKRGSKEIGTIFD